MASAVSLRADYSALDLRRLAATTRNANQSRRLLSLAAVLDGMNRTEAAKIGGNTRPTCELVRMILSLRRRNRRLAFGHPARGW